MVEGENLADVRPEAKAKAEVSPARMEQTDSESESELLQPTAEQVQNLSEDTDEPAKSAELVNSETSDDSDEEDYLDGSTLEPYWIENPNDCLHDWHRCPFTDEGVTYQTVRQFVHYHLLMRLGWEYSFFADASLQSLQLILSANSPAECTSVSVRNGIVNSYRLSFNCHL